MTATATPASTPARAALWAIVATLTVATLGLLAAAAIVAAPAVFTTPPDQAFVAAVRDAASAHGVAVPADDAELVATGRDMCAQMSQSGLDAEAFSAAIVTGGALDESRGRLAIATASAAAVHLCP